MSWSFQQTWGQQIAKTNPVLFEKGHVKQVDQISDQT